MCSCIGLISQLQVISDTNPNSEQVLGIASRLAELTKELAEACADGGIDCAESLGLALTSLETEKKHTADGLRIRAEQILDTAQSAMFKHSYLSVPPEFLDLIDNPHPFGKETHDAFPSATQDAIEAGNCLAAACSTAAVFHLVRAAEIALRALALDRGVEFPNSSVTEQQCGVLISALDSKIAALGRADKKLWPNEAVKKVQLSFYHSALMEFRSFNEAWRKQVCHAGCASFYDENQAISVYDHVQSFMSKLATRISETEVTPEYWVSL
jgi:hypothetical protein